MLCTSTHAIDTLFLVDKVFAFLPSPLPPSFALLTLVLLSIRQSLLALLRIYQNKFRYFSGALLKCHAKITRSGRKKASLLIERGRYKFADSCADVGGSYCSTFVSNREEGFFKMQSLRAS